MRNLERDLSDLLQTSVNKPSFSFDDLWSNYENDQSVKERQKTTRWWLSIGIPAIFVLGAVTAAASSVLSNYTSGLRVASHTTGVFEYVNGTPVSNEQFQLYKAGQEMVAQMNHQSMPTTDEIVHRFNQEQVAYQEAQKEHLVVTDKQALNYSLKMEQMFKNPPAIADKSNFAHVEKIIQAQEKGLGISDDQYWTQWEPQYYKFEMSIGNLRNHFIKKYKQAHPGAQRLDILDVWNQYTAHLLNQATIKQVSK